MIWYVEKSRNFNRHRLKRSLSCCFQGHWKRLEQNCTNRQNFTRRNLIKNDKLQWHSFSTKSNSSSWSSFLDQGVVYCKHRISYQIYHNSSWNSSIQKVLALFTCFNLTFLMRSLIGLGVFRWAIWLAIGKHYHPEHVLRN